VKLAFLLVVVASTMHLSATVCIPPKKFDVQQVCGTVTNKDGAVIPNATIEVTPIQHPEARKKISSDKKGRFALPNVTDDEYEIRVKYTGFWDAWQPVTVGNSRQGSDCKKPIHVVMFPLRVGTMPVGGCSYIESTWKESTKKSEAKK
jgi:hypothetical protein